MDENCWSRSQSKKRMGKRKAKIRHMLEDWEDFTWLIQMTKNIQKISKTQEVNWKNLWRQPCYVKGWLNSVQASSKRMHSRRLAMKKSSKQCVVVLWNPMNPRDSEQNLCSPKCMKIVLTVKGFTSMSHFQFGTRVSSCATGDEDSGCKSCRGP